MEPENDPQLSNLLKEWEAPSPPPSLERRVLGRSEPWWRILLLGSVRVPIPVLCSFVLFLAVAGWHWNDPSPPPVRVVIKTEKVDVPVVRDRVVRKVIYRRLPAPVVQHTLTFHELRPVSALRPRILRNENAQN